MNNDVALGEKRSSMMKEANDDDREKFKMLKQDMDERKKRETLETDDTVIKKVIPYMID